MTPIVLSWDQQIAVVKPSISLKQEVSLEVGEKMDLTDMYLRFQWTKEVSQSWTIGITVSSSMRYLWGWD